MYLKRLTDADIQEFTHVFFVFKLKNQAQITEVVGYSLHRYIPLLVVGLRFFKGVGFNN